MRDVSLKLIPVLLCRSPRLERLGTHYKMISIKVSKDPIMWIVLCCEVCFGVILLSPTRSEDDRGSPDMKLGILNMRNIYRDANPLVWLRTLRQTELVDAKNGG